MKELSEWNPERVSNMKHKYNWDGIKHPSKIDNWITFEKNNPTIALNVLNLKEMGIYIAYISKFNSNFEKRITFLMILNK